MSDTVKNLTCMKNPGITDLLSASIDSYHLAILCNFASLFVGSLSQADHRMLLSVISVDVVVVF